MRLLAVYSLVSIGLGGFPVCTAAQDPWAALTQRDLTAIHATILEHHPGPVDSLNPGFRSWLDSGYVRAMAMASEVHSLDGLVAVVSYFATGFQDGHLGWWPDFVRRSLAWPGIMIARRNGRYVVHHVASWVSNPPAVGAEMLSCGGVPVDRRMADEVMPYSEGIGSLEASRARLAPSLLVWDRNPWRTRPASCRVRETTGERTIPLTWAPIGTDSLDRLQRAAAYGPSPTEFDITFPHPDVAWVTVPSLAENVGQNRTGLEGLVRRLPSIRNARLIVMDVRGNHGGNSYWGTQLLIALFGEDYITSLIASQTSRTFVQWRASAANVDFVEQTTLPRFDPSSATYRSYAALVEAMRRALRQGAQLTSASSSTPTRAAHPEATPFVPGTRVMLLTDGWCASACLDFVDVLRAIPGVRHAGATTYADAIYIDNRSVRLPSDLGWFGFSMKVYRNRPRAHNQPYEPTLTYAGLTWDTPSLQRWLVSELRPR